MGPVTLNKHKLINKAGIEVNVIPIMRSPVGSPTPKKKISTKRASSEMGFHRKKELVEENRGSLPDLHKSKNIPIKGSILETVLKLTPNRFLSKSETGSTDSLATSVIESTHSFASTGSISKGALTNAVVTWLQKSSPFASSENIEQHSGSTSTFDPMETGAYIFDDEESVDEDSSLIPTIFISEEETSASVCNPFKMKKEPHIKREHCSIEQTPLGK